MTSRQEADLQRDDVAVFDASALLALVLNEPGGDAVAAVLQNGVVSALISCEVQTRLIRNGMPPSVAEREMQRLELQVVAFNDTDAAAAAAIYPQTRHSGLSLADRACLILARTLWQPVYTADHPWADLDLGLDIRLIR